MKPCSMCGGGHVPGDRCNTTIIAHSLSEYKRLDACGVNVEPPKTKIQDIDPSVFNVCKDCKAQECICDIPTEAALEPCPFCGSPAIDRSCDTELRGMFDYWIGCSNASKCLIVCHAAGDKENTTKEQLIKEWNNRAGTAEALGIAIAAYIQGANDWNSSGFIKEEDIQPKNLDKIKQIIAKYY